MGSNVSKSNNPKETGDVVINRRCENVTGNMTLIKRTIEQVASLFQSNGSILVKARDFEIIYCDQDCSDHPDGSILRKKRVSIEKDAVTFIMENFLIAECDFETDNEKHDVDDEIDFSRLLDLDRNVTRRSCCRADDAAGPIVDVSSRRANICDLWRLGKIHVEDESTFNIK